MTDRELMQMALNALEHLQTDIEWQYKSPTRAMLRKVEKALRARLAQPEPEPVAWYDKHGMITHDPFEGVTPLYTAPPQREWVGLTDEEVRDLWSWSMTAEAERTANTQQHAFARAIEAKLKEKNGTI